MGTTTSTRPAAQPGDSLARFPWLWETLRRPLVHDIGAALLFLGAALWLLQGLWTDPAGRMMALNPEDQTLIEWFLADGTRVLLGEHGFVSDRLNVPDGMNMLANATALALAVPLAPLTLALGAPVSFAVITVGNLAATATAFYLLFARTLGVHRGIALVGGAFCGFAPALVSHTNSHWHMTSLWLVSAIVWSVVRLLRAAEARNRHRCLTSGLWLAAIVVVQYFLGLEVLYLTAVTLVLMTIGYAVVQREWSRRVLPGFVIGMGVAVAAASIVLAYPLWVQLAGPGSVTNGPFPADYYSADLASFPAFSPLSIAGSERAAVLATSAAEYNTFLGWPLLVLAAGCAVWLRHRPLAVVSAGTGLVMAVLSLGPELVFNAQRPGIPMPYALIENVPVIDGALPQRYAVALVPLIAVLLVLGLEQARSWGGRARYAVPVAAAVALVPLVPTPLPTESRAPVPEFISAGHWRQCADPGGVLVPVPLPTPPKPEPMRWATAANAEFALPEGFFIGPYGRDGRGSMGTYPRPTSRLLADVAATGDVPAIDSHHRADARDDVAYWDAQCVVLAAGQPHEQALLTTLTDLFGPGERIADAWVWRA